MDDRWPPTRNAIAISLLIFTVGLLAYNVYLSANLAALRKACLAATTTAWDEALKTATKNRDDIKSKNKAALDKGDAAAATDAEKDTAKRLRLEFDNADAVAKLIKQCGSS